jgi:hypothetical protein
MGDAHILLDAHDGPSRCGIPRGAPRLLVSGKRAFHVFGASVQRIPDRLALHLSGRAGRKDTPAKQ